MNRNRRNRRSDVAIDLTSLLDVIFIILLVVMCVPKASNAVTESELADQQEQVSSALEEAEMSMQIYEDFLESLNNTENYIVYINITVPYNKDELFRREINLIEGNSEVEKFPLVGVNVSESFDAFRKSLVRIIEKNPDRPIMLSLNRDDDRILYRDEKSVTEILEELSKEYADVYLIKDFSEEEP